VNSIFRLPFDFAQGTLSNVEVKAEATAVRCRFRL
jgi:hypothetical protein